MNKKYMRVGEFAARIGRSASTVRRWDRTGVLHPSERVSGQRAYTDDDVRRALTLPLGLGGADVISMHIQLEHAEQIIEAFDIDPASVSVHDLVGPLRDLVAAVKGDIDPRAEVHGNDGNSGQ